MGVSLQFPMLLPYFNEFKKIDVFHHHFLSKFPHRLNNTQLAILVLKDKTLAILVGIEFRITTVVLSNTAQINNLNVSSKRQYNALSTNDYCFELNQRPFGRSDII